MTSANKLMRPTKGGPTYIFAPPNVRSVHFTANPPKSPFHGAKPWQESVYYFWWEYLRRHDGYRETCRNGGRGKLSAMYRDFGDVCTGTFMNWFDERGARLFAEMEMPRCRVVRPGDVAGLGADWLLIAVPKARKQRSALRHIRELLRTHNPTPNLKMRKSTAAYPVASKPVLSSLHAHLRVYDEYKRAEEIGAVNLVDIGRNAGVAPSFEISFRAALERDATLKRVQFKSVYDARLRSLVSRHYRIACQYIENVAKGQFPKRTRR